MSKMKRIAFVTPSPMAVNSFLKNHIITFSDKYDIYVISNLLGNKENKNLTYYVCDDIYSEINDYSKNIHVEIMRRIHPIQDLIAIMLLIRLFSINKFHVVHSITSKAGVLTMVAAKISGVPVRFHTYTGQVWATKRGFSRFFFKFIDSLIAKLSSKTFSDSRSQLDFLVDQSVVPVNKIAVLGNGSISGVNLDKFKPNKYYRKLIRNKFGIANNELVFMVLCRLTREKGVIDLAKAFLRLLSDFSATLLIVGPDEEQLIPEINRILGDKGKGKFFSHGFTQEQELFLNAADIHCLPSYREGFGLTIIEAAAVGVPTLASNIYGIKDTIIDNETGLLHEAGDIDGIYSLMKYLALNPEIRLSLGKSARKRVAEKFSMEQISASWLHEYNKYVPY
jgi:glycosyltransferase involved in cell wall biosynthesis